MHYLPLTDGERAEMLRVIGVDKFDDLLRKIPNALRQPAMNLPLPLSEVELQVLFRQIGAKNRTVGEYLSFLGAGSYEHFIPAAVFSVLGRHEFYTAYTPYQSEASQGTLQTIFEFQSLVSELMGLDVSNASHYDGATSMTEAAVLALRHTSRNKILMARSVHPHYRQVLQTYLGEGRFKAEEIGFLDGGALDRKQLISKLDDSISAVIVQTPNFFGTLENLEGLAETVHAVGALLILVVNPISLGILKSPGEWGADLAVGDGQPLGIPIQFGGPYLGLFSATRALMRKIPGRLTGMTVDADGRRAYCLTLQAREQHIRREKASSNICSNQALCALAACVYMTLLGKSGIRKIGELNIDRAHYLRERLSKLRGYSVLPEQNIFNEFIVKTDKPFAEIDKKLADEKIFPGVALEKYYPEMKNQFLVCATETKSKSDLDHFAEVLARC